MRRRRIAGTVTTYPAADAFRDYLEGTGTLETFRQQPGFVTETLYREENVPAPCWLVPFLAGLVLGIAVSVFSYFR